MLRRGVVKVGPDCRCAVKWGLGCGQTRPRLYGTSREWSKSALAVDKVGADCRSGKPILGKRRRGWSSEARPGPYLTIWENRSTAEGEFVHRGGGL